MPILYTEWAVPRLHLSTSRKTTVRVVRADGDEVGLTITGRGRFRPRVERVSDTLHVIEAPWFPFWGLPCEIEARVPAHVELRLNVSDGTHVVDHGGSVNLTASRDAQVTVLRAAGDSMVLVDGQAFVWVERVEGTKFTAIHRSAGRVRVATGHVEELQLYQLGGVGAICYGGSATTARLRAVGGPILVRDVTGEMDAIGRALVFTRDDDGGDAADVDAFWRWAGEQLINM